MDFIIKPLVTEKMTAVTDKQNNKFGFIVRPEANKLQIKSEVEGRYNVNVKSVTYTKHALLKGRSNAFKKAIVTLAEDETIDFYSNI